MQLVTSLGFQILSISLLCHLTFVLPLSSPESQSGYGCSWWRLQESQCLREERLSVTSSGPKQTALLSSPCKKNGITMTGADKSDLPLGCSLSVNKAKEGMDLE